MEKELQATEDAKTYVDEEFRQCLDLFDVVADHLIDNVKFIIK